MKKRRLKILLRAAQDTNGRYLEMVKMHDSVSVLFHQDDIRAGFAECFRVLDPAGFLIFKWAESSVKTAEVLRLAPHAPMFGTRTGKSGATHWLTFANHPRDILHALDGGTE